MRTSFFQDQTWIYSETPLEQCNEQGDKGTLKEFKLCLAKFDTDKMNFEPILATTKNRDIGYEYF